MAFVQDSIIKGLTRTYIFYIFIIVFFLSHISFRMVYSAMLSTPTTIKCLERSIISHDLDVILSQIALLLVFPSFVT